MDWLVALSVNVRISVACAAGAHNANRLAANEAAASLVILFVNFMVLLLKMRVQMLVATKANDVPKI